MKICPVGAELFFVDKSKNKWRMDRQTWQTNSRFSQFCERPKKFVMSHDCVTLPLYLLVSMFRKLCTVRILTGDQ